MPVRGLFAGLPKLNKLLLDHNPLATLYEIDMFENFVGSKLRFLDLSYCQLSILPSHESCKMIAGSLTDLNLRGNVLTFFNGSTVLHESDKFVRIDQFVMFIRVS